MAPLIADRKRTWLVTGSAGFIGSHLVEALLRSGQQVVSLDNFATGHRANLAEIEQAVGREAWRRHIFLEGSIVDPAACRDACRGVDIVLHHAALGSVPRSIADITLARELLGCNPTHTLETGLTEALSWYVRRFAGAPALQEAAR